MKNYFRLVLFIYLFSLSAISSAQFINLYGSTAYESSRSVVEGFDSSIILSGTTGSNSSNKDVLVSMLDNNGEIKWAKKFGGSGDDEITDILKTKDSSIVFVGYTTSSNWDGWIVKLDLTGNIIWSKKMGGSGNEFFRTVYQTKDSGYLVGGGTVSYGTNNSYDAWFIKLDKDGNLVWNKKLGGNGTDYGMYAQELLSGNILFTFYTQNTASSIGGFDWNLIKFTSDGNVLGQRKYGSSGDEGVRDFKPCQDGNFWIIGETSNYSTGKAMVIKIDTSGDQLDRKIYQTSSTAHLDFYTGFPTADSGLIGAGYLGSDAIFIKLDKNLNVQWTKTYVQNNNQLIWNGRLMSDKSFLFVGYSGQTGTIGSQDILLIKMDSLGNFDCRDHSYSSSIFNPASNVYSWGTMSLSTSSAGTIISHTTSSSNFSLLKKSLNFDSDSLPINLGNGQSTIKICKNDSTLITATSKATVWEWSNGSDTSFTYLSDTGKLFLEIKRPYCVNKDSIIVEYFDTVKLGEPFDTLICHNQKFTISPNATGGRTASYVYTWRDSVSGNTIGLGSSYTDTFDQEQSISLILFDNCGLSSDTVYYHIYLKDELSVLIPQDTLVCSGEVSLFYSNATGGDNNSYQFEWLDGLSTSDTLQISSDSSFQIKVKVTDGCSVFGDSSSFLLTVRTELNASLNQDTTICIGEFAELRTTATGGDSTYNYLWNNGLGQGSTKVVQPQSTTSYRVILSDECTIDSDTAIITVTVRSPLQLNSRSDTTVCKGEMFPLYSSAQGGVSRSYLFSWNNGLDTGRNQVISLDTTTRLRVILSDDCTTENDTDYINITVRNQLSISLGNDTILCKGQVLNLSPITLGGNLSSYSVGWNLGLGNGFSKSITADTSCQVKAILSDGCTINNDSSSIQLTVRKPLDVGIRSDSIICKGQSIYLYSDPTGGDSSYVYLWDNGLGSITTPLVSPTHSTSYTLILNDGCTVDPDTGTVFVSVRDSLYIQLNSDTTICRGETVSLRANSFGGFSSQYQFIWNNGLSNDSVHLVQPEDSTTYRVILNDNCTSESDTALISVFVRDSLSILARNDTTICKGQGVNLYASSFGGNVNSHVITWNNGLGVGNVHSVSPDTTTTYQVILTDNCTSISDTDYVIINVRPKLEVIPRSDTVICVGESVQLYASGLGGYSPQYSYSWSSSIGSANYITISPSITTIYQVVLADNCTLISDTNEVVIKVRQPLNLVKNGDTTICVGEQAILNVNGAGGDSTNYLFAWNLGLGNGMMKTVFPDTTTTYKVNLSDGCTALSNEDSIIVYVRAPLKVQERSDTFICVGESVKLFANAQGGFSSNYQYIWDNSLDTGNGNIVTPPVTTQYQVILRDNCTLLEDTGFVNVFVRKPLTLIRRSDTLICKGEQIELYFDGTGGDSLHYTFIWNHDAGTGNYRKTTPDSTTTYKVNLTDNCTLQSGLDSVTISVRSPLSVSARSDTTVCIGESLRLGALAYGGFSNTYELEWNNAIGIGFNPLIIADTSKWINVTLRDYCTVDSSVDSVLITVRPPLVIDEIEDTIICIGETVRLYASGSGGLSSTYGYQWNLGLDTGQQNYVDPKITTIYQVILSDGCTIKSDTGFVKVTVRDPLSVTPRSDTTICKGENVVLYASGSGGDSTYSFLWDGGAPSVNEPLVSPYFTQTYKVKINDACTIEEDSATVTIYVRDSLKVEAAQDTEICIGQFALIYANTQGGNLTTHEVSWDNNIGIVNQYLVSPNLTTTYQVILKDYCTAANDTDEIVVRVRDPLKIIPRSDTTICIGELARLYGTASGGYSPNYTYTWNYGLPNQESVYVSPLVTTDYNVILNDNCTLLSDTARIRVNVREKLQLTLRADTFICQGENVILYAFGSGGDSLNYKFSWNQNIGTISNPIVSPPVNTNYFVTLSDGCTVQPDTGSVNIELPIPLTVIKTNDTLVCRNSTIQLGIIGFGGIPSNYQYLWDGLGTGDSKTVSPSVTTYYPFEFKDNCAIVVRDSVAVHVQVPKEPIVSYSPNWACVPNNIAFKDSIINDSCWYYWDFGDNQQDTGYNLHSLSHSYNVPGEYDVKIIIKSPLGCFDTSRTKIYNVYSDPISNFEYSYDVNSNSDMAIKFINKSKGALTYIWDFGDKLGIAYDESPIYAYESPMKYQVVLTSTNQWGCTDSFIDTIDVKDIFRAFIPNAMILNGVDTLNSNFGPFGTGILRFELEIYNRWGELVFNTKSSEFWKGTYMNTGSNLPSDVYLYSIRVFSTRGDKKTYNGSIHLIR